MSDATWWFLQPSGMLVVALALAWLLLALRARAVAHAILGLALVALAAVVLLPLDVWGAAPLEARSGDPASLPDDVHGIIVLGGSVDWRVTVARDQLNLGSSAERMLAAAALARRYPEAELVFTGIGREVLAHDLTADPGPTSLLFGDAFADREPTFLAESASTYDDALLSTRRLAARPGETWLLVTSAWHMPRAWSTFRTLGWTTVPYPVDYLSTGRDDAPVLRLDSAGERLAALDRIVREWGAVWVYRRTGRISQDAWDARPAARRAEGPPLFASGGDPLGAP